MYHKITLLTCSVIAFALSGRLLGSKYLSAIGAIGTIEGCNFYKIY